MGWVKLWILRDLARGDKANTLQELGTTFFRHRRGNPHRVIYCTLRQGEPGRGERDELNSSVGTVNCPFDKTSAFESPQQLRERAVSNSQEFGEAARGRGTVEIEDQYALEFINREVGLLCKSVLDSVIPKPQVNDLETAIR